MKQNEMHKMKIKREIERGWERQVYECGWDEIT